MQNKEKHLNVQNFTVLCFAVPVFGKFKPKRTLWYVFDERECQLLAFKSEEAVKEKKPESSIRLSHAAMITPGGGDFQFVIL